MTILTDARKQEIVAEVLAARAKRDEFLKEMKQRQQEGLKVAQNHARILKDKFGVQRVVLFGSLLDYEKMSWHSDIDLAVWGLPEKDYFKAVGTLLEIAENFSVDLVEVEQAKPYILKAISQGMEL